MGKNLKKPIIECSANYSEHSENFRIFSVIPNIRNISDVRPRIPIIQFFLFKNISSDYSEYSAEDSDYSCLLYLKKQLRLFRIFGILSINRPRIPIIHFYYNLKKKYQIFGRGFRSLFSQIILKLIIGIIGRIFGIIRAYFLKIIKMNNRNPLIKYSEYSE